MIPEYRKIIDLDQSEGEITAEESSRLNESLSNLQYTNIPQEHYSAIREYLEVSFALNTIEPSLKNQLEDLLENLRSSDH